MVGGGGGMIISVYMFLVCFVLQVNSIIYKIFTDNYSIFYFSAIYHTHFPFVKQQLYEVGLSMHCIYTIKF